MKRLLNGEYLTKSDVRRKDKELSEKTEKRSTTKKKQTKWEPRKERQEVS